MNIGLIRVSSIGQKDNTSLSNQKKMINDYCSVYSIELDEIIEEVYTGTTSDRDGLNHLKSLIENGDVESVVVMKLDRLMRSFSEGVVFIKYLFDNDVKIISVLEKIDTSTTSGRFFMNVLLSLNEMERDTIVERMNSGKIRKFENHKKVNGRISFGYKKYEDNLILDKQDSKIVQYIYKRYLELRKRGYSKTKSMRLLRVSLKKKNYLYKGKEFTSHTIRYILSNIFYTGMMTNGSQTTNHNYDKIVSTRLFNLVSKVWWYEYELSLSEVWVMWRKTFTRQRCLWMLLSL